ncbi:MAG: TIGR00270 family protein [Promethearchaeota archaeon]|nr:MAG: TIGR00270 family protein [Candidatus Lokiarchaeota archaeon]
MPKPQYNEIDKECPICGSIIWGRGQRVILEGAKITVCLNCAQHGIKIQKPAVSTHFKKPPSRNRESLTKKQISKKEIINELEISPDYAKKIRNVRNSLGLNQDQFAQKLNEKPSLIRRIEAGKVEPTIKLAKKIEDVYKIEILKKVDEIEANVQDSKFMKRSSGTSLGDIAFIKKKK